MWDNTAVETLIYRELLALGRKMIYLNLYTDICLPLAGKYILKPCSGSKFVLTALKIEHCVRLLCKINLIVAIETHQDRKIISKN